MWITGSWWHSWLLWYCLLHLVQGMEVVVQNWQHCIWGIKPPRMFTQSWSRRPWLLAQAHSWEPWLPLRWASWTSGNQLFHSCSLHNYLLWAWMSQCQLKEAQEDCIGTEWGVQCWLCCLDGPVWPWRAWLPWRNVKGWMLYWEILWQVSKKSACWEEASFCLRLMYLHWLCSHLMGLLQEL